MTKAFLLPLGLFLAVTLPTAGDDGSNLIRNNRDIGSFAFSPDDHKNHLERSIAVHDEEIAKLEAELGIEPSGPVAEPSLQTTHPPDTHDDHSATLMITVTEGDHDQLRMRLPSLIKAQNHVFTGGRLLIFDNNGAKPSGKMQKAMMEMMDSKVVDGFLEADHHKNALERLYKKVGHRFTPENNNLGHYLMLSSCQTRYLVHFDLNVALYSQERVSWVDKGIEVLKHDSQVLQVITPAPPREGNEISGEIHRVPWSEVGYTKTADCEAPTGLQYLGGHFIQGHMFLMDTHRYHDMFPLKNRPCTSSNLQWEQGMSCTACSLGLKRAELVDSDSFWHIELPAPAGEGLQRALTIVKKGIAVTSAKEPHKAADLSEWDAQYDFIIHMNSEF